jgi:hypothetical protein
LSVTTVWHYTLPDRAAGIVADGVISLATVGVPSGEKPAIWFSARQLWEPTVNKLRELPDGRLVRLTNAEMFALKPWRFGVPIARVIQWRELIRVANIGTARQLERHGRSLGADPRDWYGSLSPVSVGECVVQVLDSGEWRPAAQDLASG